VSGREVRSLEHLSNTASTARVLNLRALGVRHAKDPEHWKRPMFANPTLNKAIILKHRLRQNEHEMFTGVRHSATKVLLPIEVGDLRMGARYIFVGQTNFDQLMSDILGIDNPAEDPDYQTLIILDEIPSLDPFLLREQLKRQGIDAAPTYFDVSEGDMNRMLNFAQQEIQHLVEMSFGGEPGFSAHSAKLARKILMNDADAELEPLRKTMQLDPQQYREGIFCWKAFLYYKWRLTHVLPQLNGAMAQISSIAPRGAMDSELRGYLAEARETIRKAVVSACRKVRETLNIYDEAYEGLTKKNDPLRFRDFLLRAPEMFNDLGERLGAVDHIISFWRFRFPEGQRPVVTPEELADIFTDFEQSLAFREVKKSQAA
jgi:hypothetical protein